MHPGRDKRERLCGEVTSPIRYEFCECLFKKALAQGEPYTTAALACGVVYQAGRSGQ